MIALGGGGGTFKRWDLVGRSQVWGHALEGDVVILTTSCLFASWLLRGKQLYPPQAPITIDAVSSTIGLRATDRAKQPWAGPPETVSRNKPSLP